MFFSCYKLIDHFGPAANQILIHQAVLFIYSRVFFSHLKMLSSLSSWSLVGECLSTILNQLKATRLSSCFWTW